MLRPLYGMLRNVWYLVRWRRTMRIAGRVILTAQRHERDKQWPPARWPARDPADPLTVNV